MSDAFTSSFVNKTNPGPYHQVLVLSQAMINNAFENMWFIAEDDSNLHNINMGIRGAGTLKAKILAPKIAIQVTTLNPQLYYLLHFESGKLSLYLSNDESDDSKKEWDVAGWVFAFPVSISRKTINRDHPQFDAYHNDMGLPAGDFSLARLLIDSSRAAAWNQDLSTFNGTDWSKENSVVQTNFATFVNRYVGLMVNEGKTVIGIALQANEPSTVNQHAPSFPPTSLDYYMYPWIDPSAPAAGRPTDNLDQNALCYLIMTGDAQPPSPAVINYSGAFVNSDNNHGGIICMNTSQFWDAWLLPIFRKLNKVLEFIPTAPYAAMINPSHFVTGPRYTFGANPSHMDVNDVYFGFQPALGGGWNWQGQTIQTSTTASDQGSRAWQSAFSSTNINFGPGGQSITLTGSSVFIFNAKAKWQSKESTYKITTNWHLNYALGVVNDGGLQIVRIPDPTGTLAATSSVENISDTGDWNIPWGEFMSGVSDMVHNAIEGNVGDINNTLIHGLEDHHKLFLPASGTFLMRDAKFNKRGDLMVALAYNGATPPQKKSNVPDYLRDLPARAADHPVFSAPAQTPIAAPFFKSKRGDLEDE